MADKRVSEMTRSELRATITSGVFVGILGIAAIGFVFWTAVIVLAR